jgi:hypothetical protein
MPKYTASVEINATSNLKKVTKDIDKSLTDNQKSLKKVSDSWGSLGKNIGKTSAVAAAGIVALSAGIFAAIKKTADFGDELDKTSQQIGVSVDDLQRLRFAFSIGGASSSEATTGIRFFNRSIDEASQGVATYKDEFDALGISIVDSNGKTRSQLAILGDVADAYARMEDGSEKTASSMNLFGRAGSKLIPTLNGGSEQIKTLGDELAAMNAIMSVDQTKASAQFNDDLNRMRQELKAIGFAITADAIGPMNEMINTLRKNLPMLRDWVDENVDLGGALESIGDYLKEIDFEKVFDVSTDAVKSVISDLKFILNELREAIEWWQSMRPLNALKSLSVDLGASVTSPTLPDVGAFSRAFAKSNEPIALSENNKTDINLKITVDQDGRVTRTSSDPVSGVNLSSEIMIIPR